MSKTARLQRAASRRWPLVILIALGLFLAAFGLAWVSTANSPTPEAFTRAWPSFLGALFLAALFLWAGWSAIQAERPPIKLAWLLVAAAVLRLAVGVIWFTALPGLGHGSPQEQLGYVMADAHERDQAAWDLATSGKPLTRAFGGYHTADQYGGMLFLSAALYRLLGSGVHYPLLVIVLTAAISALAVPFTWAFARRLWDERTAYLAAWLMLLYPEAVLLGSSQMREAFFIPLAAAAAYGIVRYRSNRPLVGLTWIVLPLAIALPVSPPFAALLLFSLVLLAVGARLELPGKRIRISGRLWLVFGAVLLLTIAGLWITLSRFAPPELSTPWAAFAWWFRKSAEWQAHLSLRASGWVQKIFESTPQWTHLYLLVGYGVLQPFLPAALLKPSTAPIWQGIAIWRSLGWTMLLPLLAYAPLRLLFAKRRAPLVAILSGLVWLVILLAAFRGGGDQWDNPRYRAAFASLQVALAAWAWIAYRRSADAWLRRMLVSLGLVLLWFVPWYLMRQYHIAWPVQDVLKTLGLGVASALLYILGDWTRTQSS